MANNVVRIALPSYDATSDTNIDHYALYTDQDNVLIKEYLRGTQTIASGATYTITHNFGYVPVFFVYGYDLNGRGYLTTTANVWKLVPHLQSAIAPGFAFVYSTTTAISITNTDASSTSFKYYVFYDNQVGSSAKTMSESASVFKVAKSGVNALTSVDPNDYIFHSDLNTFKILKEGNASVTYTADGAYTFAHGASISNPTSHVLFVKFPDGYTAMAMGDASVLSRDKGWNLSDTYLDTTNFGFRIAKTGGSGTGFNFKYYIFETPLS